MKPRHFERIHAGDKPGSDVRVIYENRELPPEGEFSALQARSEDDPVRLHQEIMEKLRHYFLNHRLTYISGQMEDLQAAVEAVLSAQQGTVSVVSLAPGGGKSTLLRAAMAVFAQVFSRMAAPIAQRLGGAILVVEKSAEAHEYEQLCNREAGRTVAVVVEAANDYVLGRGGCFNGSAACYEECPHRSCPDYDVCPAVQAVRRTEETPS